MRDEVPIFKDPWSSGWVDGVGTEFPAPGRAPAPLPSGAAGVPEDPEPSTGLGALGVGALGLVFGGGALGLVLGGGSRLGRLGV